MKVFINTPVKTIFISVVIAGFMVACAPIDPETGQSVKRANPEMASLGKKIAVQQLTPVFVSRFDNGSGDFSDLEKGRLLGFLEAQQVKYGEVLSLELPAFDSGGPNEQRYGAIGSFLESQGFDVKPKIVKDGLQNSLRVFYTKYVATVDPNCAKGWRNPVGSEFENLPLAHLGCATASALTQIIADPKDLVDPKNIGGFDGERAAKSIEKYRAGSDGGSGASTGGASSAASAPVQ
jgi:pilus biogenesis lipoprotein CpaD